MPARPWFAFYPSDWRGDPKLRSCSPVSRLVWLEMMGLAHEAEPYGHVLLNGDPVTPEQLAKIAGVTLRQVNTALVELERAGVFSCNDLGVPYSRRMVRDEATRLRRASGGKDSLNNPNVPRPKDHQETEVKDTSKDILPPVHKGPPQIPEVRSQKSEEQQQQQLSSAAPTSAPGTALVPIDKQLPTVRAKELVNREKTVRRKTIEEALEKAAQVIFTYWRDRMGFDPDRTIFNDKRRKRLIDRLLENDGDVSEMLYVVDGALRDDWTMGRDARSVKPFNGIATIFRDREKCEELLRLLPPKREDIHPYLRNGDAEA